MRGHVAPTSCATGWSRGRTYGNGVLSRNPEHDALQVTVRTEQIPSLHGLHCEVLAPAMIGARVLPAAWSGDGDLPCIIPEVPLDNDAVVHAAGTVHEAGIDQTATDREVAAGDKRRDAGLTVQLARRHRDPAIRITDDRAARYRDLEPEPGTLVPDDDVVARGAALSAGSVHGWEGRDHPSVRWQGAEEARECSGGRREEGGRTHGGTCGRSRGRLIRSIALRRLLLLLVTRLGSDEALVGHTGDLGLALDVLTDRALTQLGALVVAQAGTDLAEGDRSPTPEGEEREDEERK